MSRYTIEMNFAKAKGQAKELDNAAARLERIASGSICAVMSCIPKPIAFRCLPDYKIIDRSAGIANRLGIPARQII